MCTTALTRFKKYKIRRWVEDVVVPRLEKLVIDGTVISFTKSRVSESSYININNDLLDVYYEIRVSDHKNRNVMGQDYTVYMSEDDVMKTKRVLYKEILEYIQYLSPQIFKE
jgi:hypothetical protein